MTRSLVMTPTERWALQRDFMVSLPVAEEEAIQTGPGDMSYNAICAFGQDVVIAYMKVKAPGIINLAVDRDWLSMLSPLKWSGSLFYNGREARPGDLYISTGQNAYTTRGQNRHNLAFGVRKSVLRRTIAGLCGIYEEDVRLGDLEISLSAEVTQTISDVAFTALLSAGETRIDRNRRGIHAVEEAKLLDFWARLLAPYFLDRALPKTSSSRAARVVGAAESILEADDSQPTVAALCSAAGVSERHLRTCFHQIFGISPIRYMKLKRLSAARERFLDVRSLPRSVKEVALDLGFVQSGRFAIDYKSAYGEPPSATLARSARGF